MKYAKKTKMVVFWVVAPYSLVEVYQHYRGPCCLHHQVALMMVAARTSETLVNFYQTARRYNPENSHLRTHRRENLKSYMKCASPSVTVVLRQAARSDHVSTQVVKGRRLISEGPSGISNVQKVILALSSQYLTFPISISIPQMFHMHLSRT
jgi:hypothetical protein